MLSSDRIIKKEYFDEVKKNVNYNYQIADFYLDKCEKTGQEKWGEKGMRIGVCCKLWDVDFYRTLKIKDIKRVSLCKDKFCINCQKALARKRQDKFEPMLDELSKEYEIFHMVVTVPNCIDKELLSTVNKMYKKFQGLTRYFKGQSKVKGFDFLQYGYGGAVRSLEITYNKKNKEFHPHFHIMILLKKGLELTGEILNPYSFKSDGSKHKFSKLEILLQKIWFLLMNDERVTAKAIEELKLGYDVYLQNSAGEYHECFKYACKGAFDEENNLFLYNEQIFWTLYEALDNRRIIQGYGKLYNFGDLDEGDIIDDETDDLYERIVSALKDFETPSFMVESLDEILERVSYCLYLSKNNIKRVLAEHKDEIKAKHILLAEAVDDMFSDEVQGNFFDGEEDK